MPDPEPPACPDTPDHSHHSRHLRDKPARATPALGLRRRQPHYPAAFGHESNRPLTAHLAVEHANRLSPRTARPGVMHKEPRLSTHIRAGRPCHADIIAQRKGPRIADGGPSWNGLASADQPSPPATINRRHQVTRYPRCLERETNDRRLQETYSVRRCFPVYRACHHRCAA